MSQKKNIDEYFKEGLSGFTLQPSEKVWNNIEKSVWPRLWVYKRGLMLSAAAILLVIVGFVSWYYFALDYTDVESVTDVNESVIYENTTPAEQHNAESITGTNSIQDEQSRDLDSSNKEVIDVTQNKPEGYASSHKKTRKKTGQPDKTSNQKSDISSVYNDNLSVSIYTDIGRLPGLTVDLENNAKPVLSDSIRENLMAEFRKKQHKSHFYTGIYFTPAMMYYPSVKDQFTFTAGLDFGMTIKRFYLETGIAYQQIKEQGIYTIDLRSFDSVGYYNQVQSFEVNPLNANEIIYNTKEVVVYDSVDHYTHVVPVFSYEYINIPFTIGYKVFHKDRFTVGIEAGVILSMMVDKQIPFVDFSQPEYRVVLIHNETPERVNTNFRWQLAVILDMKLVKAMSVSVKPVFNKYLNSIYDTQSGFPDVKPYSMGIQFGIKYGF